LARTAIVSHGQRLLRSAVLGWCLLLMLVRTASGGDEIHSAIGYRNGRPLTIQLVVVDWIRVEIRTAQAFRAMQRAADADGIELVIRSGFRTHESQGSLYQRWRAGVGNPAARPGFSNHQSGRALDLVVQDPRTLAWLDRNARRFGFRRTVPTEPWHWELVGGSRRARR